MGTRRGPRLPLVGLLLLLAVTLAGAPAPPSGPEWDRVVVTTGPGGAGAGAADDCTWRMIVGADQPDGLVVHDHRPLVGVQAELTLPGAVRSIALAPDGSRLYAAVGADGDGALVVVETEGWTVSGSVALGAAPDRAVVADDGRHVVVTSRPAEKDRDVSAPAGHDPSPVGLWVIDPHRHELVLELATPVTDVGPDGARLALLVPAGAHPRARTAVWVDPHAPLIAGRLGAPVAERGLVVGPLFGLELQTVVVPSSDAHPRARPRSAPATGPGLALAVVPAGAAPCPSDGVASLLGP